jgi:hypothetical protein
MCSISGSICTNDIGITNYEASVVRNTSGGSLSYCPFQRIYQKFTWTCTYIVVKRRRNFLRLHRPCLIPRACLENVEISCFLYFCHKGGEGGGENIVLNSLDNKERVVIFANFILGFTSYFTENTTENNFWLHFVTQGEHRVYFLIPIINVCRSPLF